MEIFLVPVDGMNFGLTVKRPVNLLELEYLTDDLLRNIEAPEAARVWGVRDGPRNRSFFESMKNEDGLLFYRNGEYRHSGRVGSTFESGKFCHEFWGEPAPLLFTVKNLTRIQVPKEELNYQAGYVETNAPTGLSRIGQDAVDNIQSKYDSLDDFFVNFNRHLSEG